MDAPANVTKSESKGRILIADDESAFSAPTASFFRAHGYECVCVSNGEEAAAALRESTFDLLLSDINMPGNAALELLSRMPDLSPGLPVILLTGLPTIDTATRAVGLNVQAYLVKPPNPQELLRQVEEGVRRHRTYRAVAAQRQKLQNWLRDVEGIEALLKPRQDPGTDEASEAFFSVTFHNLLASLVDVKRMVETLPGGGPTAGSLKQFELEKAVRDAIAVLQQTRHHFKSNELMNLRRRLEDLVNTRLRGGETPPDLTSGSEQG